MVRTSRPLVERMTLVWHDWFATSNEGVGSQRLMLDQNELFRSHALGSFQQLLLDVTHDPAMLLWLNGTENRKDAPNENYAREMMELFTLGADTGAYTERDVREQARSLTGWQDRWSKNDGPVDFHFDPADHDDGVKTVFGKKGVSTGRTPATSASRTPYARARSSSASSGRTSSRRRRARRRAPGSRRSTPTTRCSRSSRRSSATPTSTRASGW